MTLKCELCLTLLQKNPEVSLTETYLIKLVLITAGKKDYHDIFTDRLNVCHFVEFKNDEKSRQ